MSTVRVYRVDREKKLSDDAENNTAVASARSNNCCCCCCGCCGCRRYVATVLPLRYRKMATKMPRCYMVVAGLWTAALITFIAPLLTKPDYSYYRYNVNQKMCGLHWQYALDPDMSACTGIGTIYCH